ncbi:MAG: AAA family ATPase [Rhodococcus sp.]|nr:AAA family ATPase [Rhodococcus sp. (in: high G+C Gram-positive bacteria)]
MEMSRSSSAPDDLPPRLAQLWQLLAAEPGVVISVDDLIASLWGTNLPTSPRAALQSCVSRLRARLPDADIRVSTQGYQLIPHSLVHAASQPLVGRRHLLVLAELLDRLGTPGCLTIIRGPAGIGKSRLLEEARRRFTQAAPEHPILVINSRGSRELEPYAPLSAAISSAAISSATHSSIAASGDAAATPQLGPDAPLAGVLAAQLRERAGSAALTLFVDDIDELDDGSALILDHLSATTDLTILAGARTGQSLPLPLRSRTWDTVTVPPLSEPEANELIDACGHRAVSAWDRHRICGLAQGNPLHLAAAVRAVSLGAKGASADTPTLADYLDAELRDLSDDERIALSFIAFGEPLPVDVAESLIAPEQLMALESKSLIRVTPSSTHTRPAHTDPAPTVPTHSDDERQRAVDAPSHVVPAHPLYAQLLRTETGAMTSRFIHRGLSRVGRDHASISALRATLWDIAADQMPPHEQLARAIAQCAAAEDWIRVYELATLAQRSPEAAHSPELTRLRARALYFTYIGGEESITLLNQMIADHMITDTVDELDESRADLVTELHVMRAMTLFFKVGSAADAFAALSDVHVPASDPRVRAARAMMCAYLPDVDQAIELAKPLVGHSDPIVHGGALSAYVLAMTTRDPAGALAMLDEVRSPGIVPPLLRIRPLLQLGEHGVAQQLLAAASSAVSPVDLRTRAWFAMLQAQTARGLGDAVKARDESLHCAQLLMPTGHVVELRIALEFAALCATGVHEFEQAKELLDRADELPKFGGYLAEHRESAQAALACRAGQVPAPRVPGISNPQLIPTAQSGEPRRGGLLTKRERQIADLAAAGASSAAIAQSLTLSIRTVDNHLQAIYDKLHINTRTQLPVALGWTVPPRA